MPARKVRLVANVIRGMSLQEAQAHLRLMPNRASRVFSKLLASASSNARQSGLTGPLFVSAIRVDDGPILKRWMPRARGAASPLHKRTSHILVELQPLEGAARKKLTGIPTRIEEIPQEKHFEELEESLEEAKGEVPREEGSEGKKGSLREDGRWARDAKRTKEKEGGKKGFFPRIFRRKSV